MARAQTAVRSLLTGAVPGDIVVQIAGGGYPQAKTLTFGPEDSAEGFTVTYAAAPGQKVLLTGGRTITGWQRVDDRLWMAEVPEAKSGRWYFDQLFVDESS